MASDEVFDRKRTVYYDGTTEVIPDRGRHYHTSGGGRPMGAMQPRANSPVVKLSNLLDVLAQSPDLSDARCKGEHPIFDWPSEEPRGGRTLTNTEAAYHFIPALALCAQCPLAGEHGACIASMRPAITRFSGVAGGFIFYKGKPLDERKLPGRPRKDAA